MYAAARRGDIRHFTGIDDPYEAPQAPELTIETTEATAEENARKVIDVLRARGFVRSS